MAELVVAVVLEMLFKFEEYAMLDATVPYRVGSVHCGCVSKEIVCLKVNQCKTRANTDYFRKINMLTEIKMECRNVLSSAPMGAVSGGRL